MCPAIHAINILAWILELRTFIKAGEFSAGNLGASSPAAESNAASQSPGSGGFGKDAPMREFKKLYGLIKIRSRKDGSGVVPVDDTASANGRGSDASSTEKDR